MPETDSKLTKQQYKTFGPRPAKGYGKGSAIWALVRYDDECGNGHNTFSITGHVTEPRRKDWVACGCIHEEIAEAFPELAPYIKWHLCSSDGPMHYIANTVYLASERVGEGKERDLDAARSSAIWPDATDDDLILPGLQERLAARLPALLEEFRRDVESLGFGW